jgi:acetylserotonin N-methyltransferase
MEPGTQSGTPPTAPVAQPDPTLVLDLLTGFRRSRTMFAAVALGVFEALAAPRPLAALAEQLGAQPASLERLLDACVGLGLLEFTDGKYANTALASAYLRGDSPASLVGYVKFSDDVLWKLWTHLDAAAREGTHRWQQAFGWDGPIFAHHYHSPQAKREFLLGMHGMGMLSSPHVVAAFDLGQYTRLIDLGGATGHLAIAACRRYPGLRAVLFELPGTDALAREIIEQSPVADRISVETGDFFQDDLPPGDLFALGRILHDWSDEKAQALLARIHRGLPSGGAVLIAEKLLREDRHGPPWALSQDLNMLCCTEGRERTFAEYARLLDAAGFSDARAVVTPSPLDAVIASKP